MARLVDEVAVDDRLKPGTRVEVRTSYDRRWARGFEIHEVVETAYRLRRLSDLSVLPRDFAVADVRRERRRQTWWI